MMKTNSRASGPGTGMVEAQPTTLERSSLSGTMQPLRKLKRILVPVDFSDASLQALQYAVPYAEQFGATLYLLHVVEPIAFAGDLPGAVVLPSNEELVDYAGKQLFSLANKEIEERAPVNAQVRIGKACMEIVGAAKALHIDLIVIATHGYTGIKRLLLGSTAEKVVRSAPCPVLVVREPEHEFA
jgi:nucleotide-binding universal stress UspA family protein